MADKVVLSTNVGTGDSVAADDLGVFGKVQWVKLMDGTDNGTDTIPGTAATGLRVDPASVAVADGGTLPAKGVQVGGTDGSVFQVISTDSAGRVNTNVNGTVPISATNLSTNVAQVAGTATDVNSGNKSAGTQRVVLATDQPALTNALKVDGSAVTQPVSGTVTANAGTGPFPVSDNAGSLTVDAPVATPVFVRLSDGTSAIATLPVSAASLPLPAGASTAAKQPALGTAGAASADVLSVQGVASMTALKVDGSGVTQPVSLAGTQSVNQAQISGTATSVNSGNKDAGTQRVTLATDQVALTNALKVDGSAVTQPVSGTVTANLAASAAAAGYSKFHLVSAGTTNATNIKASAGKLHGWYIYNSNAAARKVAFHNTAGSPTAGTGVTDSIVIPPTSAANAFTDTGIAFSTGIAITTVTDLTDAGTTAVAASDLVINLYFI